MPDVAGTGAARKQDRAEPTDKYFDDWCRETKKMQFRLRAPYAVSKSPT
jgi:hypothetical protein